MADADMAGPRRPGGVPARWLVRGRRGRPPRRAHEETRRRSSPAASPLEQFTGWALREQTAGARYSRALASFTPYRLPAIFWSTFNWSWLVLSCLFATKY